jgi:hypothetical protein
MGVDLCLQRNELCAKHGYFLPCGICAREIQEKEREQREEKKQFFPQPCGMCRAEDLLLYDAGTGRVLIYPLAIGESVYQTRTRKYSASYTEEFVFHPSIRCMTCGATDAETGMSLRANKLGTHVIEPKDTADDQD